MPVRAVEPRGGQSWLRGSGPFSLAPIFHLAGGNYLPQMEREPQFVWKQCIVVRSDIRMSCGKTCAQVAHAAIAAYERADATARRKWFQEGQKKVVLKVPDERGLFELKSLAEHAGIATGLVQDAGLTEIPPGTVTALGLGPAKSEELDRITGSLSLL